LTVRAWAVARGHDGRAGAARAAFRAVDNRLEVEERHPIRTAVSAEDAETGPVIGVHER
jgi:hypothetical protein